MFGTSLIAASTLALMGGGILGLILTIAIIGVVVWLLTTYLPLPPVFRTVIWVLGIIAMIYVLVTGLGAA